MLTVAFLALAVTALLAGMTGSWSPCGLSSVETIGSGMGRAQSKGARLLSIGVFSIFCLVGGAVTFGAASALGAALGLRSSGAALYGAALIALFAGAFDFRLLPIRPQVRNQVPEPVRRRAPLPVTAALYGLMLGLGFTTYLLTWAMWALLVGALLVASPLAGVVIGLAFGLGRALPVIVLAGTYERASTQRFIDEMETGPLLVGLRRIDGVALMVCAAMIFPIAAAEAALLPGFAYNPSDGGGAGVALSHRAQNSSLLRPDGSVVALGGRDAALGDGLVAWRNDDLVTIADAGTLAPREQFLIPGVNALALDGGVLAYRATEPSGRDSIGVRMPDGGAMTTLATYAPPTTLSRPAIDMGSVVFGVWSRRSTRLIAVPASGGAASVLREDSPWHTVSNPAVLNGQVAYVRTGYCDQTLMLGRLAGLNAHRSGRSDRPILRIRSQVRRDGGYEPKHERHYNGASKCQRRKYASYEGTLWTTSLGESRALVTLLSNNRNKPRVISIAR